MFDGIDEREEIWDIGFQEQESEYVEMELILDSGAAESKQ